VSLLGRRWAGAAVNMGGYAAVNVLAVSGAWCFGGSLGAHSAEMFAKRHTPYAVAQKLCACRMVVLSKICSAYQRAQPYGVSRGSQGRFC
jgi:hypothetical protein